jgi:hypothetical protein
VNPIATLSSSIVIRFLQKYFILFNVLLIGHIAIAQTNDTLSIYTKIKKVALKHKATTLLYQSVFVEPVPKKYDKKPLSDKQKQTDPNLKYSCRTIRKIQITVYDPFGYSMNDTTRKEINPWQKIGNKYHVSSHHKIIRNLLLFKKNDPVDILVINESERLLRETNYISDARIFIIPVSDNSDSVDIQVTVQDRWTLTAPVTGGTTGGSVTLRERNILGWGQQYAQFMSYDLPTGNYQYSGNYAIGNIRHTYISSSVSYLVNRDLTQTGFSFDRPFYSALAKWAGGIASTKTWGTYKYTDAVEQTVKNAHLDYLTSDVWVAKNMNTGTGKKINRKNSNIVVALRYVDTRFQSRPAFTIDTAKTNLNSSLYLGSIGFSLRKYYKDQYIYRFGYNEDVPEGLIVQYLYGLLYKELSAPKYYTGFEVSRGKHFEKFGYFSVDINYGTYYNKSIYKDAIINSGIYYFSDLLKSRKWYLRQFVNYKLIYGFDKFSVDKITLRPDELYGFNNGTLKGTSKMVLNLETVSYAPYNLIGFRFAPIVLVGFGMLETDGINLLNSKIYEAYSTGLLIRNENLVNASFQITYGIYPNLPDGNTHFYKFNPVTSFTLKVKSFAISKPSVVIYE